MELKYKLDHKMKMARDFENQGKFLHAAQLYFSLLEDFPDNSEVNVNLANLFEMMGNSESGINLLTSHLEKDPEDIDARLFLGQFLLRNSKWNEAIDVLSYLAPEEEPVASFFLGYSYFMLKDFELSKKHFLDFLKVENHTELLQEANIYLAKNELNLGNFESALSFAKKAELLYSDFWELNLIYAQTYYNLKMYTHSVTSIEKALKLNPQEPSVFEWAGKIYLKVGDYKKAEFLLRKFIEKQEFISSDIYTKLAEACLKSKKTKDALVYFDLALKLDPDNKSASEGKKNASTILKNNVVNDV